MKGPTKYMRQRMLLKHKPRKILNLEERVEALKLYDRSPVYQRVASTFKCSWEQIKNIVSKREAILNYYARCQIIDPDDNVRLVRQKKINFLGNTMYEYIKRVNYHGANILDDDVIRQRALEFRNIIEIDKFYPNKAWVSDFKHVYNVDLQHLDKIILVETPHKSLECKDIVAHCRKEVERVMSASKQPLPVARLSKDVDDIEDDESSMSEEESEDVDVDEDEEAAEVDDEALIENECGQVIYFGDGGDDDINGDDEPGSTISYGDYNYNEEEDELKPVVTDMTTLMEQNDECDLQTSAADNLISTSMDTSTDIAPLRRTSRRQKASATTTTTETDGQKSYSRSPPLPNTSTPRIVNNGVKEEQPCHPNVADYAEALNLLRPLEEFALREEDFPAINLISQLADFYEKAHKRRKISH